MNKLDGTWRKGGGGGIKFLSINHQKKRASFFIRKMPIVVKLFTADYLVNLFLYYH